MNWVVVTTQASHYYRGSSEAGMAPQSCPVLREGAGVHTPHHQAASVVGVCSWVRWLSSTESNYGGRMQLESLIPREAITAGRLSVSILKKASGEHCSVHYSPLCATWIHVLCTVSSGNSSSRILVDRFSWGNLQEEGNGRTMQLI